MGVPGKTGDGFEAPLARKALAPSVEKVEGPEPLESRETLPMDRFLEEWTSLESEDWGREAFVDEDPSARVLPSWVKKSEEVVWRRFKDVFASSRPPPAEEKEEKTTTKKKKEPEAKKSKEWVEIDVDPDTNEPRPRVVVVGHSEEEWPPLDKKVFGAFLKKKPEEVLVQEVNEEEKKFEYVSAVDEEEEERKRKMAMLLPTFREPVDAVGASLLKLCLSFGEPYLSIYPQDSRGRPCYNAAGKYVLKFWLAGAYRRITVDDSIPLIAGIPIIASSSDPRELWVSLIVKGLYKLWATLLLEGALDDEKKVSDFFVLAATALNRAWSPFVVDKEEYILPEIAIEEVLLLDDGNGLSSPKKKLRRKRKSTKEVPLEVRQVAVDQRNAALRKMRDTLLANRDEVVIAVKNDDQVLPFAPALAYVTSDLATKSLLVDWDAESPDLSVFPLPAPTFATNSTNEEGVLYKICAQKDLIHEAHLNLCWRPPNVDEKALSKKNKKTPANATTTTTTPTTTTLYEPPAATRPWVLAVVGSAADDKTILLAVNVVADRSSDEKSVVVEVSEMSLPGGSSEVLTSVKIDDLSRPFAHGASTTHIVSPFHRVFARAPLGAVVSFFSNANIELKSLDSLSKDDNFGRLRCHEGKMPSVKTDTEQVLFRRLARVPGSAEEEEEAEEAFLVELWLSNELLGPLVTLYATDLDKEETRELQVMTKGRFAATELQLRRGSRGVALTATIRAPPEKNVIMQGEWALYATFKDSSGLLEEVDSAPTMLSFGGSFYPNDCQRLFRDVLEVPTECFPLHLGLECPEHAIVLRLYEWAERQKPEDIDAIIADAKCTRGSTGDILLEVKGHQVLSVPCLWPQTIEASKKNNKSLSPPVRYVVEATIDDELPEALRSQKPYAYVEEDADENSGIRWRLQVAAAQTGVVLRHDAADDAARFALVRHWERSEPGRAERAKTLRRQVLERKNGLSEAPPSLDREDSTKKGAKKADKKLSEEEIRIKALGPKIVSPEVEAQRENIRRSPLPPAIVDEVPQTERIFLTEVERKKEASALDDLMASSHCSYDLVKARIDEAKEAADDAKTRYADAIRAWRDTCSKDALLALQRREAYRASSTAALTTEAASTS